MKYRLNPLAKETLSGLSLTLFLLFIMTVPFMLWMEWVLNEPISFEHWGILLRLGISFLTAAAILRLIVWGDGK